MSAGRGTPRERRCDEHAHALGSVAVGASADGRSIVVADGRSTGASSMILTESDSVSVSDAARGDKTSAGEEDRAPTRPRRCFGHGADDQAGADSAALEGERVEKCADRVATPRTTGPGALQTLASRRA